MFRIDSFKKAGARYRNKRINIQMPCLFKEDRPAAPASMESLMTVRMALRIGTIMAVVAVLLIHIDRNQLGSIMPNINLYWKIYITANMTSTSTETNSAA